MPVIGCLFLIVLPLLGVFIGGAADGKIGMEWGAGLGFVIALMICAISTHAFIVAARRSRH